MTNDHKEESFEIAYKKACEEIVMTGKEAELYSAELNRRLVRFRGLVPRKNGELDTDSLEWNIPVELFREACFCIENMKKIYPQVHAKLVSFLNG